MVNIVESIVDRTFFEQMDQHSVPIIGINLDEKKEISVIHTAERVKLEDRPYSVSWYGDASKGCMYVVLVQLPHVTTIKFDTERSNDMLALIAAFGTQKLGFAKGPKTRDRGWGLGIHLPDTDKFSALQFLELAPDEVPGVLTKRLWVSDLWARSIIRRSPIIVSEDEIIFDPAPKGTILAHTWSAFNMLPDAAYGTLLCLGITATGGPQAYFTPARRPAARALADGAPVKFSNGFELQGDHGPLLTELLDAPWTTNIKRFTDGEMPKRVPW